MMTNLSFYTILFVVLTGFFFGLGFHIAGMVLAAIGRLWQRK